MPPSRLGAGDYILPADRIARNEVICGQETMCLAYALNASRLHLPALLQMGFILASQEVSGREQKQRRGIVPQTGVEKRL